MAQEADVVGNPQCLRQALQDLAVENGLARDGERCRATAMPVEGVTLQHRDQVLVGADHAQKEPVRTGQAVHGGHQCSLFHTCRHQVGAHAVVHDADLVAGDAESFRHVVSGGRGWHDDQAGVAAPRPPVQSAISAKMRAARPIGGVPRRRVHQAPGRRRGRAETPGRARSPPPGSCGSAGPDWRGMEHVQRTQEPVRGDMEFAADSVPAAVSGATPRRDS